MSSPSELSLSVTLTLPNGVKVNTLPELLQALEGLPVEEQRKALLELNDRTHEVLQRQDEIAGALFAAGLKAGFYNNNDARFAGIREANKRRITADHKRTTILTALRKYLPSYSTYAFINGPKWTG